MLGTAVSDKNAFLSEISAAEYAVLRGHLAPYELRSGHTLQYLGEPVDDVIFPHSGLVAMSMPLRDNPGAAAALIGRDGMIGALAVLAGAPAASDAVVHIAGHASRMPAAAFRQVMDQNSALRRRVARHTHALVAQSQQNALCHAVHPVEARICRWLLAIQARCASDRTPLTQSTLAQMLGVRRTTVTLVAGRLEAVGVIRCHRGYMQIADQQELEHRSCECHGMLTGYVSKLLTDPEAVPADEAPRVAPAATRQVL